TGAGDAPRFRTLTTVNPKAPVTPSPPPVFRNPDPFPSWDTVKDDRARPLLPPRTVADGRIICASGKRNPSRCTADIAALCASAGRMITSRWPTANSVIAVPTFRESPGPIGGPETVKFAVPNNLQKSRLTVSLKLDQSHFKDGRKLLLQCTALINTLYKQSSELQLPIKSTEPVPEKVTSPNSGCQLTCTGKPYSTVITAAVLLWNVLR
ncbi:Hypothetical protein CINCED_3A011618, partial [Cinara cedri]